MLMMNHRSATDSPALSLWRARVVVPVALYLVLAACAPPLPPPAASNQPLPEQRALFAQPPDNILDALREGCMSPTQRLVQVSDSITECRMLMPPDATAGAILRYDGTIDALPELVIRLRLEKVAQGYELGAAQFLEVPRAAGDVLHVVYPDPVLDRRLRFILTALGGTVAE